MCTDSRGVRWRQALEARRYALWNGLEAKEPMNAREAQVSLREKFFHKPRQKAKKTFPIFGTDLRSRCQDSKGLRLSTKRFCKDPCCLRQHEKIPNGLEARIFRYTPCAASTWPS